jgi:MSHA pilin protein MshC
VEKSQGFTLIEWLLVMVLIAIVGATASPMFVHHEIFQERFFIDEMSDMMRYAHRVATATGCEVQINYDSAAYVALYQRQHCTTQGFTKKVGAPFLTSENTDYVIKIPAQVTLKASLPIYIDSEGRVYDQFHHWQKKLTFEVKNHQIIIDGFSGFVYEKTI